MKARWYPDELMQHFTLFEEERSLLSRKTTHTRLGFVVLLKFFQYEGRFPSSEDEVPEAIINHLAAQLDVPADLSRYNWSGRTIKYHRSEIREFLGFREATVDDAQRLLEWLLHSLKDHEPDKIEELAYAHLRENKIEPPGPERFQRIIASAIRTHEQNLQQRICSRLPADTRHRLDALLDTTVTEEDGAQDSAGWETSPLAELRKEPGKTGLESVLVEARKLQTIRDIQLPLQLFDDVSPRTIQDLRRRAAVEPPRELRRHPEPTRYSLLAAFCWSRGREITDNLVDLLVQITHRIGTRAENKVNKEFLAKVKKVHGKEQILFSMAEAALDEPGGVIEEVLFPIVGEQTLQDLVKEYKATGPRYRLNVQTRMRKSYSNHYRRMLPKILSILEFRSNNEVHQPVIEAIELLKRYRQSRLQYYPQSESVPIDGVISAKWLPQLYKKNSKNKRVHRIFYELGVLEALRERLRTKEIWVVGADRWRNPDEDLPSDFSQKRQLYYEALKQPQDVESFISQLQNAMTAALTQFDRNLPKNPKVTLRKEGKKRIKLSPLDAQVEAPNLRKIREELVTLWPMTDLLDMLKETDLRTSFTEHLRSVSSRETMEPQLLRKRLLLCLYGLGTNIGLKRVAVGENGENYKNLQYVLRRFIGKEQLRAAISQLVNEILAIRLPQIWGETTTSCASDSKHFGAWDQNLMTEWHSRYGGRGIMIYWHVGRKSTCIYSQLKRCSSSEVAAMIEGVLRHCSDMEVEKQYVDSHGQSLVGFAFCHVLGFRLLPRLKSISGQKLFLPRDGEDNAYPNLQSILTRAINWDLIRQQYDEIIKYTTALRLGTANADAILRRFTQDNKKHPTYQALLELGRAVKTIFLCQYLDSVELRHEIQEALNVIELWNRLNDFILIGKKGEMATNRRDAQELFMLCLHLLQNSLIYINTLMLQKILTQPHWENQLSTEDLRALTPLLFSHVNPYGRFDLDMEERLPLDNIF